MMARYKIAVERYLKMRGFDVLDWLDDDVVVIDNDEGLAFARVVAQDLGEMTPACPMKEFDEMITCWFKAHPDAPSDVSIRYDVIVICVISEDRAIIKHQIGAELV